MCKKDRVSLALKCHTMIFMRALNVFRSKFIGDQVFWGPKKSGAHMKSGAISVIATTNTVFPHIVSAETILF